MRAQEHLHKGGSSSDASMLKSKSRGAINQSILSFKYNSQEIERLMMSHEDQMARLQSKAQGEVLRGRDQMRLEVMESLDRQTH